MARLPGVSDRDAGWGAKIAFFFMKRQFVKLTGRETETMLDPLRMYAHIPKLLSGYGKLEQAVAKVHCVSDADSDQSLVGFQTEEAIVAVIGGDDDGLVSDMVSFGLEYAAVVRDDHRHFVEAFRGGRIPGVTAT